MAAPRNETLLGLAALVFAAVTLWFSFHIHSRAQPFTYKSQIFEDKAGYYIYLPAAFVFCFDADAVPDSLSERVSGGFRITDDHKIYTKYPIGVAVMQAPFFLLAHGVIAPLSGQASDGFSPVYHAMVDVAGWAYMLLGMALLFGVLRRRFSLGVTLGTLALLLLGTNLAYYYSVESGMSHIYSFCLVAALLRLLDGLEAGQRMRVGQALALGAVCALLVVTRFTNVVLLSVVLAWGVRDLEGLRARFGRVFALRTLPLVLLGPAVLVGLQLAYYHYLTGGFFLYTYGGEGFDLAHPEWVKALFSPRNGLFPHAPMVAFALVGLGTMAVRREVMGWYGLGLFAVCSYLFASWWQWYFGCAFGQRSYVELYPILAIGLGRFLELVRDRFPKPARLGTVGMLVLLCLLEVNHMYHYKLCYIGQGDWDWVYWWGEVTRW